MAWYYYPPAPGKQVRLGDTLEMREIGPCVEPCAHIDCREMREHAASACRICSLPIGYEGRIYFEGNNEVVHAQCLEREAERTDMEKLQQLVEREHPDWKNMLYEQKGRYLLDIFAAYRTPSGVLVTEGETVQSVEQYLRFEKRITRRIQLGSAA